MNTEPLEPRQLLAAITSGTLVNGNIATSNQVDSYTISVTSGAQFLVAVHDTSNSSYQPRIKVLSPSSATVLDQSATDGVAAVAPTASTGTYTVQVSSAGGTGAYSLIVFRPTANTAQPLQSNGSGQRDADTVGPGEDDLYSFDVTAGQSMTCTVTENNVGNAFDPHLALIAPDGRIVGDAGSETGVRFEERATKTGTYYAVVTDDGDNDTGVYGIAFTRVPGTQYAGDPDTNVPLPPATTRQIDVPGGDADAFELPNIHAGDGLSVSLSRITNSTLDPDIVLYDPNGATVVRGTRSNGNATSSLNVTAALTGTYWVVARDFEADDGGMGNFRYDVTAANPTPTTRTISGTAGDDKITVHFLDGGSISVSLNGGVTDYDLEPGDHLDIQGGDGNDVIDLRDGTTSNYIAAAGIYVTAGSGDDTVYGSIGGDTITGGSGRNRLFGNDGNDRINGSGGRDFLYGEGGNDRLYGQGGNDYIDGGGNVDRVYGGDGDDSLQGGGSNDRIYAGNGNDTLIGGKGNDYLNGESGTDVVLAKEDADTLINIESVA